MNLKFDHGMILVAIFIGKNSLGFISGNTYELRMSFYFDQGSKDTGAYIRSEEGLKCEYTRVEKFLENWMVLNIKSIPENTKFALSHVISLITKSLRVNKLDILLN